MGETEKKVEKLETVSMRELLESYDQHAYGELASACLDHLDKRTDAILDWARENPLVDEDDWQLLSGAVDGIWDDASMMAGALKRTEGHLDPNWAEANRSRLAGKGHLRPCPFCGGPARAVRDGDRWVLEVGHAEGCLLDDSWTPRAYEAEDDLYDAWNAPLGEARA